MSDIRSILRGIQDIANTLYGKHTDNQRAQFEQEQAHTHALLAQHEQARQSLHELFKQHGFDVEIQPFPIPQIGIVRPRIGASPTVTGFGQVWRQLLNAYVHQDTTPDILAQTAQINAEIERDTLHLKNNYMRFSNVVADSYFMASVHTLLTQQTTPSMLLWRIMHGSNTLDNLPHTIELYLPHPALIHWHLQHAPLGPFAHLLAWYADSSNTQQTDYMDVLNLLFASTTQRTSLPVSYNQWPTRTYHANLWRPIQIPSATMIDKDSQRIRKHGNLFKSPYSVSYSFVPNEYSQEQNFESEDALLFEVEGDDFIVIVSDGVSQSAMGSIGARSVTQMLHVVWQELKQHGGTYDEPFLNAIIKRALHTAKIDANTKVAQRLYSDEFKATVSERIWRVLDSLYQGGGTQSTFSCVFRIRGVLYAISMGNSGILIQGQQSGVVLHPDDDRFKSDSIRFSSGERTGMRGEPFISVYPTFLVENTNWRVVIHSDALAEYKDRTALYEHPLVRPSKRALNLDDDLLAACITVDDTTIVEFYCGT